MSRRLPIGAELLPGGWAHFRVWAPRSKKTQVVLETPQGDGGAPILLAPEGRGYFSGIVAQAAAGSLYRFYLDGCGPLPDPASRSQPQGPHGPSQIIDPAFSWTDAAWHGPAAQGNVIYEMHVGTFTGEGTLEAARARLPELAELGVSIIELMPLAAFPGRFGWGYDGVSLFAPTALYGSPDDLRRFVDRAHAARVAVILDVVYNHFGPDGNYLAEFSPDYFTDRHATDWGKAINYDGPDCGPVREFMLANAAYWIAEFHMDGLRVDATQDIYDDSKDHFLAVLAREARRAAGRRSIFLAAENEPQDARIALPADQGGFGFDALWNDDFHHAARVALTGHNEGYYSDYRGAPQEFISAFKWGFLYQGQRSPWQQKSRGTPTARLRPSAFVHYLENHDQVSNSLRGRRLRQLSSPASFRALTTLLLLGPQTPLLFQGQEFGSSRPFVYFADHHKGLAGVVQRGRWEFLRQFSSLQGAGMEKWLPPACDAETFSSCKLDHAEKASQVEIFSLHQDLIRLRREDPALRLQSRDRVHGAVLGAQALALRIINEGDDRLILVNLGLDLALSPNPEPLLAPPETARWRLLWSSEDPRYGGSGACCPVDGDGHWRIQGHCAAVLEPRGDA